VYSVINAPAGNTSPKRVSKLIIVQKINVLQLVKMFVVFVLFSFGFYVLEESAVVHFVLTYLVIQVSLQKCGGFISYGNLLNSKVSS
jgi:hypothetical protein